jgi:hypothetical protein
MFPRAKVKDRYIDIRVSTRNDYSTFHIHEMHSATTESAFQENFCTSHNWKVL